MSAPKVVVVDYQLGNIFSVLHACRHVGMNVDISNDPQVIRSASALILPGVGAFPQAMEQIERLGLAQAIRDSVKKEKPLFGVCLGLQLLFSTSEEFGETCGLNLISGKVRRFSHSNETVNPRIPQIGWNRIYPNTGEAWTRTPMESCASGEFMYFVHSYFATPNNAECVLAETNYRGQIYCSAAKLADHVVATQFHPEKSGPQGLAIYRTWARLHNLI